MKKQTAVEWLVEAIQKQIDSGYGFDPRFDEKIINQSKEMEQTNSIENLIDRNVAAQKKRGKDLSPIACLAKINEEVEEYNKEWAYVNNEEAQQKELSDIILSCFTKAKVMGWDIMEVLSDKVAYNEKRED